MKKRLLHALCSLTTLFLLTGCGASASDLLKYVDDNDFEGLSDFYYQEIEANDENNEIGKEFINQLSDKYELIQDKYSSGEISYSDISFLNAVISEIDSKNESYVKFQENIETIYTSISNYNAAISYYNEENYQQAIYSFELISPLDTAHYSGSLTKIAECESKLEEIMQTKINEVKTKLQNKNISEAQSAINQLKETYGENTEIEALSAELKNIIISDSDTKISSYFDNLDYKSAYDYIEKIYYEYGYEEFKVKLDNLEDEFVDFTLQKSETDANAGNYEAASAYVQSAIEIIGDDSEQYDKLNSAYNEYKLHLPVYISELDFMSETDGCCENIDEHLIDNVGNTYRHSYNICNVFAMGLKHNKESWQEFYLNGNYKTFSGTIAVRADAKSSEDSDYFDVYGDGKLLYTSPKMTKSSLPEEFSIDVSGVKVLKISYPSTNGGDLLTTIYDGLLNPKD